MTEMLRNLWPLWMFGSSLAVFYAAMAYQFRRIVKDALELNNELFEAAYRCVGYHRINYLCEYHQGYADGYDNKEQQ